MPGGLKEERRHRAARAFESGCVCAANGTMSGDGNGRGCRGWFQVAVHTKTFVFPAFTGSDPCVGSVTAAIRTKNAQYLLFPRMQAVGQLPRRSACTKSGHRARLRTAGPRTGRTTAASRWALLAERCAGWSNWRGRTGAHHSARNSSGNTAVAFRARVTASEESASTADRRYPRA